MRRIVRPLRRLSSVRFREPLRAALAVELHELDRIVVRVWQVFSILGVIAGSLVSITLARGLGLACAGASGLYFLWFLLLGARLQHGPGDRGLAAAMIVVESTIPWSFMTLLVFTEGAGYALASWVPPMLFCGLIVAHTARLRARASLIVGVIGGLTYPLLYLFVVRDRLDAQLASLVLYQLPMQITRGVSCVLAGFVGALVASNLKNALFRAETVAREQDLFGKYRLLRRVARGGMGEVLEAVYCPEGGFERRVAVKRIHPELAEQPQFVTSFRAEAELGARLAHPNIVQVLDFGRVGDTYFLAMEFVEGMTLSALMRRAFGSGHVLAPQLVGTIAREILSGLVHAHEVALGADGRPLRVVHRDMCPQNVLLSRNGEVKITDFGVARALKDAAVSHTRTIVGHAAYMAPEQARSEPVDTRSDLFPVGVIVWELLAGRQLFRRRDPSATIYALLHEEVPALAEVRPGLHPAWDAFVRHALARRPSDRWASAREMIAALDAIAESIPTGGSRELPDLIATLAEIADPPPAPADEAETQVDPVRTMTLQP